jgi:NAD(P)-dependent dehydrogenase (short-subunit alcohol dehydrogenase family)
VNNPLDFSGRVVLVTGGTKGIGRSIAARYAEVGATVVVCGRRPPEAPDGGADGPAGPAPDFVACDVRDPDQVDALVAGIVERNGRLDVAVNNAGGAPAADAATASPRFTEAVIRLNLLGPAFVAQAAYRAMRANPPLAGSGSGASGGDEPGGGARGAIVNIASVSGTRPSPGTAAYGAAKAGLLNLTETLAVEWAPEVRVNAVVAGLIATEQAHLHYGDDEALARVAATVPMGRLGRPSDVADACLVLSSPLTPYVTGAALRVHGGGERPAYLGAVGG